MASTAGGAGRWFLSFDCATKTFAFSLCWIDLGAAARRLPELRRRQALLEALLARAEGAPPPERGPALARGGELVAEMAAEVAGFFRIADGDVQDLLPGVPDREAPTVARIRAVARYVKTRIRPALEGLAPLRVLVEYQLGANAPARAVSDALVALFAEDDVALVGPALKNRVTCSPGLHYGAFAARYASAYAANKAHALSSFKFLEATFGSGVPRSIPDRLRGHIADAVMQSWGHVLGGEECGAF